MTVSPSDIPPTEPVSPNSSGILTLPDDLTLLYSSIAISVGVTVSVSAIVIAVVVIVAVVLVVILLRSVKYYGSWLLVLN